MAKLGHQLIFLRSYVQPFLFKTNVEKSQKYKIKIKHFSFSFFHFANRSIFIQYVPNFICLFQLYSLYSGAWSPGPSLPFPLYEGRAHQTEDTFLVLGGYDHTFYHWSALELDLGEGEWRLREETMGTRRGRFFMTEVDRDKFCD